jgi:hypothetical protein
MDSAGQWRPARPVDDHGDAGSISFDGKKERKREGVMNSKSSKATVVSLAKSLIAGTNKRFANTTQVAFTEGTFTPAEITTRLSRIVTLRSDVDAARASVQSALDAEKAEMPALRTFMGAFVSFIKAVDGNDPAVLADFGIPPKKARAVPTVEAKTAAAAKRAATRKARNTMGPVAKKAVKGAVTGITVTPVVVAPVPSVTPAAPASPSGGGATPAATAPAPRATT